MAVLVSVSKNESRLRIQVLLQKAGSQLHDQGDSFLLISRGQVLLSEDRFRNLGFACVNLNNCRWFLYHWWLHRCTLVTSSILIFCKGFRFSISILLENWHALVAANVVFLSELVFVLRNVLLSVLE